MESISSREVSTRKCCLTKNKVSLNKILGVLANIVPPKRSLKDNSVPHGNDTERLVYSKIGQFPLGKCPILDAV